MTTNAAFTGVGQTPGTKIWAINKFELQPLPTHEYGTFYNGDSYLILHTYQRSAPASALGHDIHFWLGSESSVDEQGSAAILAAQLDEALGGGPVQYRQLQGAEDSEFKKLFPRVVYRPVGHYSSGFTSVPQDHSPAKLYHVRSSGPAFVQVSELPLSVSSLNSGDSFVLDAPAERQLFLWHGASANLKEKMRALDVANSMRPNGSAVKVSVIDDGDTTSEYAQAFFAILGVTDPSSLTIAPAAAPSAAAATAPAPAATRTRVFRVQGPGGDLEEVAGPVSKKQLTSDAQYSVVTGDSVWVWTGSEARGGASLGVGTRALELAGLPNNSAVRSVKEGFEPTLFTTYFPDWAQESIVQAKAANAASAAKAATIPKPKLDAAAVAAGMLGSDAFTGVGKEDQEKAAAALQRFGVDGRLQVWVVRGSELEPIPGGEAGQLYSSDSYVVDYTYKDGAGEDRHVVYFWLGRQSSNGEWGTAALLATNRHNDYNGASTLARVQQGQEPPHFVLVFASLGGLVIHRGDRPAAGAGASSLRTTTHLYQVKAEAALGGPYAAEVEASSSSLNSGDCFLLLAAEAEALWLWRGKLSSRAEQAAAAAAAQRLAANSGTNVTTIEEGSEPEEFWEALNGHGQYPEQDASQAPWGQQPVLFVIRDTGGSGGVKVERYTAFSQDDLNAQDSALLDSGRELLVWYGPGSSGTERAHALEVAHAYAAQLQQRHSGRRAAQQVSISEVVSGAEPPFFTQHFPGWDGRVRPSIADASAAKLKQLDMDV